RRGSAGRSRRRASAPPPDRLRTLCHAGPPRLVCQVRSGDRQDQAIMTEALPVVYLARHGETAWSASGQHTGLTDLPLTPRGERTARQLEPRLRGLSFAKVFTSPLQRALRTCELAGFRAAAEIDRDLVEWNYGQYEGRRTDEIHAERPGW